MPRSQRLRVQDILTAAQRVRGYTAGLSEAAFLEDTKTVDAVVRNLEVIGEAAARLNDSIVEAYPSVAWRELRGIRNVLIHAYFGVDGAVLWRAVCEDVPQLIVQMTEILASLPPDSE